MRQINWNRVLLGGLVAGLIIDVVQWLINGVFLGPQWRQAMEALGKPLVETPGGILFHILLGLVKEGSGVAANVLKNLDVDLRKIRLEVEKIVQSGPDMVTMGKLPQTPRAKKVIEYSMEEARNLNHNYVGTEHILLGLLREQEGVAAQVLMNLGLKLEEVREEVLNLLGHGIEGETSDTVEFERMGVKGQLLVAADHFDLEAKLGFLLGAFSKTIESEIERNLDELLAAGKAKAAAKKAPKAKK